MIGSIVSFTMSGNVVVSEVGPDAFAIPTALLELLERQQPLEHLNIKGVNSAAADRSGADAGTEGTAQIEARFTFPSVAAFRTWYMAEETQAMLREMSGHVQPSQLQYALQVHVQRLPFSD